MLEVRDLVCGYGGVSAIKGVSLAVAEGALVALIGANGAGKTTLLKAISCLLRPTRGTDRLRRHRYHEGFAARRAFARHSRTAPRAAACSPT